MNMKTIEYVKPHVMVLHVQTEGILCQSTQFNQPPAKNESYGGVDIFEEIF